MDNTNNWGHARLYIMSFVVIKFQAILDNVSQTVYGKLKANIFC